MFNRVVLSLVLGISISVLPATYTFRTNDGEAFSDLESIYNVTTSVMDDVKESIFTIKLKCRSRTIDIRSCSLYDPQYRTTYLKSPCEKSKLCKTEHLKADNSYVGRFEIKERGSSVERLTVSSGTSLKQISFYRIMANHLLPGVDVDGKPEGTYSLIEESVYGKCEALVKVVRTETKEDVTADKRIAKLVPMTHHGDNKTTETSRAARQVLSIKRTRNLETCYPVPGLLIFDAFFYHPMMTSVHYDIKSSISRLIASDRAFTSYTTEDVAMKNTENGGNTTMLHIRTTVTLHSVDEVKDKIPRISYPLMARVGQLFEDPIKMASVVIGTETNGRTRVNGCIESNRIAIRSLLRRVANEYNRRRRSIDGPEDPQYSPYHVAIEMNEPLKGTYSHSPVNRTRLPKRSAGSSDAVTPVPDTLYPEVLVVLDNTTFHAFDTPQGHDIYGFLEYLLALWNSVDLHYRSIDIPKIRFHISAIVLRVGDSLDHIMISLESVLPAEEALPIFINPVDMEVIANRPGSPNVQ